ncbi:MAG: J domain-containing protein [Thermoleophilia bacterium]|nr:J domain-containing protein [Thermoleophilia bacterium]
MAAPDRTHYDVLGIPRDADASAVRSAWKLHVQAWHPDRFGEDSKPEAERQTAMINEAYSVLRDSSRRAAYDCRLAADEQAARPEREPARRPARSTEPQHPFRPSAAPVGSPMTAAPAPPAPQTLSQQLSFAAADAWKLVRRHPRWFAMAAAAWVLVIGGTMVMHLTAGPTLPAPATANVSHSSIVADQEQLADLEDLAAQAREESAKTDAALQQMMREDAARQAAEQAAAERAARAAALQAKRAKRKGSSAPGTSAGPVRSRDGRKIVRVMPSLT